MLNWMLFLDAIFDANFYPYPSSQIWMLIWMLKWMLILVALLDTLGSATHVQLLTYYLASQCFIPLMITLLNENQKGKLSEDKGSTLVYGCV